MKSFWNVVAAVALSAGLAGCFTSDESLIETGEAPYDQITFTSDGDDDATVLTRAGDGYTLQTDEGVLTLRFAAIGENLYVVEMSGDEDGETVRLYGGLRLMPEEGRAEAYRVIADGETGPGLRACEDDAVCIDDLEAYAALIRADAANGVEPATGYDVKLGSD